MLISRLGSMSIHGPCRVFCPVLARTSLSFLLFVGLPGLSTPAVAQEQSLPSDVESTISAAREAARNDRNAESAALFEQAIARDRSRRQELLREYADQLTYADRAAAAVPLYREALTSSPGPEDARRTRLGLALALSWSDQLRPALQEYETLIAADPRDTEARLGRARVLSWMDRLGAARAEYARLLEQDPENRDALRELARVQAWRGRHRDAARRLNEFLRDNPGDPGATFLLAQTQDWMGRPDLAERVLTSLVADNPAHREAAELLADIRLRQSPHTRTSAQTSRQSDNLDIIGLGTSHSVPLNRGRTRLEARFQRIGYDPQLDPVTDVAVLRPGAARSSAASRCAGLSATRDVRTRSARSGRPIQS